MKAASEILAEAVRTSHTKLFAVSQAGTEPLAGTDPICEQDPYPCYVAGKYEAQCTDVKIYRDPQFHRWMARLSFGIVPGGRPVMMFLNLGTGEKPEAGRRSNYFHAWTIANDAVPKKRQRLSPNVFVGKIFEVEIGDVKKRHDGRDHPECAVYSVIKEIVRRLYP